MKLSPSYLGSAKVINSQKLREEQINTTQEKSQKLKNDPQVLKLLFHAMYQPLSEHT